MGKSEKWSLAVTLLLVLLIGGVRFLVGLFVVDNTVQSWPGPSGTPWQGTQLRAIQVLAWRGRLAGEYLELRCHRLPFLKSRTTRYWPGPEWNGRPQWQVGQVTYQPGWTHSKPKIWPVTLPAPWWLGLCH